MYQDSIAPTPSTLATDSIVPIKDSIATTLLKVVFSLYFLVAFLVTASHMVVEYYRTKDGILEDLKGMQQTFEPGLARALWEFNRDQLQSTLDGMITMNSIVGVKVEDITKETIAQAGFVMTEEAGKLMTTGQDGISRPKESVKGLSKLFGYSFPLIYNKNSGEHAPQGKVTLYSSNEIVFQKVQWGFLFLIINAVIKTLALWAIFLWISRSLLSRPLSTLTSLTRQLALENLETSRAQLETSGRNELKVLEESFNAMIEKLLDTRKELERINLSLEDQVQKRTQELQESLQRLETQHNQLKDAQAQLIQAEKMAGLGILVAGVAHEINNPSNFINLGVSQLKEDLQQFKYFLFELLEDDTDSEINEAFSDEFHRLESGLRDVSEGCQRITTIVADLRTFSRLDEAEKKQANIVEGLWSTLRLIKTQYRDSVEFECDFRVEPVLECWPAQLNQVFMNMMVNACQAIRTRQAKTGDSTKGQLHLQTLQQDSHWGIRFRDTGCGIPPNILKRIFDPFFTTKPSGEGTGMGLSISFNIINRHHGKIEVDSRLREGTTMTIWLPQQTFSA